jgi:tetratricopeptide (TPR) repeat protein
VSSSDTQPVSNQYVQSRLAEIERLLGSDPASADAKASELLQAVPGEPMALLFQGIARRMLGNPAAAVEVLRPVTGRWPDAPMPHLQLGLALREGGDDSAAVVSMRRAVEVRPDFADAWLALGDLLAAMSDSTGAGEAFGRYVGCSESVPLLMQAGRALQDDRVQEAESLLRNRLRAQPNDVVALCMLADVSERLGRISETEALLTRCLELAPDYFRARYTHTVMLVRQSETERALEQVDQMLAEDPKNTDCRKLKAAILVRLLEYDESIRICEELLEEDPGQPAVWTSLGHMLKSVGRREDCIAAYRKAIELAPHYGEPHWSLANLKTRQVDDDVLDAMRAQLQNPSLSHTDRLHFCFAMGKALEDREEFEESFKHYAEGNRLRREVAPYNPQELEDHVRRCKRMLTKEFFATRSGCGAADPDPIFVLGLPRSGSTLVEQILASHSAVEGTMELPNIASIAKSLEDSDAAQGGDGYLSALAELGPEELRELGQSYLEQTRVHRKLGTPHFIDKMPNNFAHTGLIHLILPNARIIDVRRHPMACGFSLFKEHFARAQNFSYSLESIGCYYRNYVELMTHLDEVLPGRVHRVIYESLVGDTDTEIRRLLEYCDLPFEESCLHFHENARAVSTASAEQVRKPIFRGGLEHWRHYEPWLGPLQAELGPLVDTYALPQLPG